MIGIDIGSGSLKLAQMGKRSVERLAVEPLPENLVQDGRVVSFEAMGNFIKESVKKHRMRGKCAIVLPAGMAFIRRITMPLMSVDQLAVNLPFEFRDYLEQGKEKFIFDYAVLGIGKPEGEDPGSMDLLAVAVPRDTIDNYRAMFRRAGLGLEVVTPTECAYANLLRAKEAHNTGAPGEYCIVDIGHLTTHIYMFTGAAFETARVIEIGSSNIDHAIAEERSIDEFVARTHKEMNMQGALESEAAHDVYESIAVEAMKAINFYGFNNPNSHMENVYFCGGGARIPVLTEAIQNAVQMHGHGIEELLPQIPPKEQVNACLCTAAIGVACQ